MARSISPERIAARRLADRIEAGGAQPVHGDPRNRIRQAGEQQRHARHIAVVFAGLVGAAEKHLVEARPVHLRIARHQRLDRRRREIVGPHPRECAAIAPDRRSHRVADEDIAHVAAPGRIRAMQIYQRCCSRPLAQRGGSSKGRGTACATSADRLESPPRPSTCKGIVRSHAIAAHRTLEMSSASCATPGRHGRAACAHGFHAGPQARADRAPGSQRLRVRI